MNYFNLTFATLVVTTLLLLSFIFYKEYKCSAAGGVLLSMRCVELKQIDY